MFTVGVLDVLMENNITFDGAVGVSAGACFGVNIKSRQIGRAVRYQKKMCGNKRYMSLRSLLLTGNLVNAEYAYHVVPTEIDIFDVEACAANPMEFVVVCTDVHTGQPVYHPLGRVDYEELEWIRASASLPLVAKPVPIGDQLLLDGGLSDSIPLPYMQERGYDRNIVILTQPDGYRKQPTSHLWAIRLATRSYPAVYDCMRQRHEVYNTQLDYALQEAETGRALVLMPEHPLKIGRLQLEEGPLQAVYDHGREVALANLARIREYLK